MQITRKRGDTYPDIFVISIGGNVVDLTGSTLKLSVNTLKEPLNDTTQLYQLIGVNTSPTEGKVSFYPSPLQVNQVGLFYYDVQLTDSTGYITTIDSGTYEYKQDITK